MPVVLLQIEGMDNATPALTKVNSQLTSLERTLATTASSADRLAAQVARIDAATTAAGAGVGRLSSAISGLNRSLTNNATAVDRYLASMAKLDDAGKAGSAGQDAIIQSTRQMNSALGDSMLVVDAYTDSLTRMNRAAVLAAGSMRLFSGGGGAPIGVSNGVTGRAISDAEQAGNIGFRGGALGLNQRGNFNLGPVSGGAGALGGAVSIPVIVAAVAGYLGVKAVQAANDYNQKIADIVATSTQNQASIPYLQQGVLNLAGGQNRFTPQQLEQGLYPIASSPIYKNPGAQTAALQVVSEAAQPTGSNSIGPLSSAIVGAVSAYGFNPSQTRAVADTIMKGVNIGLAESPDFAKGVGTFSQSSVAGDTNTWRAFQQSVGAFAQQTNLSPKFRFDAQGENAFFQSVTGRQTKLAQQTEQGLGISNLFGVGAIGRAGGLDKWFQQIQSATAGPDQQKLLESIFGRQNALQFVRGFTGNNFGSGQVSIEGTENSGGTVARAAGISDKGPAAQWDQINSQFQKDVINVGTTISQTLQPDIVTLGGAVLTVAGKLGDLTGAFGNAIDKLSKEFNLPQKIKDATSGSQALPGMAPQGGPLTTASPLTALHNATGWGLPGISLPSWLGGGSGNSTPPGGSGSGRFNPFFQLPIQRPVNASVARGTGTFGEGAPALPQWAGMGWVIPDIHRTAQAEMYGQQDLSAADKARVAARIGALNNSPAQLLSDRGSINYDLAIQAPAAKITAALTKLADDLKVSGKSITDQRDYLEKYSKPAQAQIAAYHANDWQIKADTQSQALLDAQQLGQSPAQQKAVFDKWITDQRQVILYSTQPGGAQTRALDALNRQKLVGDYGYNQATTSNRDQLLLNTAQSNYTAAQQLNESPRQIRTAFEQYLAAQRTQVLDNTRPGATRDKDLQAITQQGRVFDYQQRIQGVQGGLRDLQNQAALDQLNNNLGQYSRDMQAIVKYESDHRKALGLSDSDIRLLAAQTAVGVAQTTPTTNLHPFFQQNAGLGALQAGYGGSAFRVGGGVDPQTAEIRSLKSIIAGDNNKIAGLLAEIAGLLAAQKGQTARPPAKGRSYRVA